MMSNTRCTGGEAVGMATRPEAPASLVTALAGLKVSFDHALFRWRGVEAQAYKFALGDQRGMGWRDVHRFTLAGPPVVPSRFELRYFELAPGGYSSLEQHALVLARDFGTPLHVLDEGRLRANCGEYRDALAQAYGRNARAIFASKACCIVATCQIAHQEGLGIDVASGGELHTALRAGVPAKDLYFHGNNKTPDEVEYALRTGVGRVVVDNDHEFDLLETLTARLDTTDDILLRLTPGIER